MALLTLIEVVVISMVLHGIMLPTWVDLHATSLYTWTSSHQKRGGTFVSMIGED